MFNGAGGFGRPAGNSLRPALGSGRLQRRCAPRPPGQERHAEHHPIQGDELRALRRLQRESPSSPFVFVSERGSPFTTAGFARMIERAAAGASLEIKAHPHMLRHACGYALANKGHDTRTGWLGHRSITSTAVYTALSPNRFKLFRTNAPLPSRRV
jgi:integrase